MRILSWPLLLVLSTSLACSSSSGTRSARDASETTDVAGTDGTEADAAGNSDTASDGTEPDITTPGDGDGDGILDADDCAPADATVSPQSVERPGNTVDDDCDGATDEAAIPATLGNMFGEGAIGAASTSVTFETRPSFPDLSPTITDAIVTLMGDGGEPVAGAKTSYDRQMGRAIVDMPLALLDLRVLNPGKVRVEVLIQVGSDTYVGEGDLHVAVIPARSAVVDVEGELYAVLPPQFNARQGASLYYSVEFFGPKSEVSPGIWSFGPTPGEFGTVPYLFYFTAGMHPDTGGEAYLRNFGDVWEGDGYSVVPANDGMAHLFQFAATDRNEDGKVDVSDLSSLNLDEWPIASAEPE